MWYCIETVWGPVSLKQKTKYGGIEMKFQITTKTINNGVEKVIEDGKIICSEIEKKKINTIPFKEGTFDELLQENTLDPLKNIYNAIYVISTPAFFSIEKTKERFECKRMKTGGGTHHLSRMNNKLKDRQRTEKWEKMKEGNPYCLYVGSSEGAVATRIKQHLDIISAGTYALHLKAWWIESNKIKIDIWDLAHIAKIKPNLLQMIEDFVWEEYLPLFGRKGAR
jgi:hypothetical protein